MLFRYIFKLAVIFGRNLYFIEALSVMKFRIVAFLTAAFVLGLFALSFETKTDAKTTAELAALLPASEIVVTFDAQKTFNTALPQILSANQDKLAEINAHIDEIKTSIGIDARQFEQIAVGMKTTQTGAQTTDLDPFILARGSFNSNQLITAAKLFSKGKYAEEKIGNRTIYIFKAESKPASGIASSTTPAKYSMIGKILGSLFKNISQEIAVTAYDNNTLAFGTAARVREAFGAKKSTVSPEILALANKKPNAVLNFGGKMPKGMGAFLPLDNDEIGKTIDAINQLSGSLDVEGGKSNIFISAKTLKTEEAEQLYDTIDALRALGKVFLGGNKNADKQVYARMVENANITRNGTEVSLSLEVPQSDIDVIVGKK